MNLATKMCDLACSMYYTKNGDWDTRKGSSHILQLTRFNLCPDPLFGENLNPKRKIKKFSM
jgi:hypothetical protein